MFNSKEEEKKPWDPLKPSEVCDVLKNMKGKWWVAGGYAIESLVGKQFREHEDIDVLILRSGLDEIREVLSDWQLFPSDPPGTLRPWILNESLPHHVHDVWARRSSGAPWAFQIMVNDSDGEDFLYKRNNSIRFNIKEYIRIDQSGIPYVSAGFQLLHKAKSLREKDVLDFKTCLPLLSSTEKTRLRDNLVKCYTSGHPWLKDLG